MQEHFYELLTKAIDKVLEGPIRMFEISSKLNEQDVKATIEIIPDLYGNSNKIHIKIDIPK